MMFRDLWTACIASLSQAALLMSSIMALANAAPAEEPDLEEIKRQRAIADEIEARPAWKWLRANKYDGVSHTFDGGIVHFVGYFAPEDVDPHLLAGFEDAPMFPGIRLTDIEVQPAGPVKMIRWQVPGHLDRECVGLIQILLETNNEEARQEAERIVASYAHHLPQRPLIPSCREGPPPPVPTGFFERIDIQHFGPLLNEPQRNCAEFTQTKVGTFSIAADTRIDNRRILVGDIGWFRSGTPFAWSYANKHYDFFMRGFKSYFYRSGLKELVRYDYGNYDPRPQDIIVATRVIEDADADVFCYVVDIEQGSAAQRLVRRLPREGKVLPWNNSDRSRPVYDPGTSLIDWGTEVAEGVLRESGR